MLQKIFNGHKLVQGFGPLTIMNNRFWKWRFQQIQKQVRYSSPVRHKQGLEQPNEIHFIL